MKQVEEEKKIIEFDDLDSEPMSIKYERSFS